MEIYIGNIPNKMNTFELQRLVNRALVPGSVIESLVNLFRRKGRIKRLEFDVVTEVKSDQVVRYGKAVVEPDLAAKNLIKKLNNLPCRGNRLRVREFGHRSYSNERRSLLGARVTAKKKLIIERRSGDRRIATTEIQ